MRPVQTTIDLAGFCHRRYPELRRQLSINVAPPVRR
jgi:hypothetical protein